MQAWDIQAISNGRFRLGIGSQVKGHNERRFSTPWSAPAPRMKEYVRTLRKSTAARRAYVRMEPAPGDRFDIDWGHFGALDYTGTPRKLYAFCLVECHSRKLYVEFTHSQSFETFVRCHLHAFTAMAGIARELWYDNFATAAGEHAI
jgi:transposase